MSEYGIVEVCKNCKQPDEYMDIPDFFFAHLIQDYTNLQNVFKKEKTDIHAVAVYRQDVLFYL
jgi:hypothetical protein